MLELGDEPQRMGIVVEAADRGGRGVERILACVTEGRVAEVVRQRDGLGQVLVQREHAGERAGDLRHFRGSG